MAPPYFPPPHIHIQPPMNLQAARFYPWRSAEADGFPQRISVWVFLVVLVEDLPQLACATLFVFTVESSNAALACLAVTIISLIWRGAKRGFGVVFPKPSHVTRVDKSPSDVTKESDRI